MKKLISIMAVWDEQNMIGLSIASTKDIVYQYIVIIKKGIDETRKVVEYCEKLWDLNIIILESEIKLREARKLAIEKTKEYADYYLIQDGDEIYLDTNQLKELGRKTIPELMEDDITFADTSIIFLEKTLQNTRKPDLVHKPVWWSTWLVPHPFLFKNTEDIRWKNEGDLPHSCKNYKFYTTGSRQNPYKFDCKIKNYRRIFLRDVFKDHHDSDFTGSIEEYADIHHPSVIWYRKNVDASLSLESIIQIVREKKDKDMSPYIDYSEKDFYIYPSVIRKFIEMGKIKGIENLEDLHYLDKL